VQSLFKADNAYLLTLGANKAYFTGSNFFVEAVFVFLWAFRATVELLVNRGTLLII